MCSPCTAAGVLVSTDPANQSSAGKPVHHRRDARSWSTLVMAELTAVAIRDDSPEPIGSSARLGATVVDGGVNFSLFSRTATGVELLFFDREDDATPVPRGPARSGDEPHLPLLARVRARRAAGPDLRLPGRGAVGPATRTAVRLRQGSARPLRPGVVVPKNYDREAAQRPGDNAATAMKSVVVDPGAYDWEGDVPLCRPSARTIIYEMHVRGFTRHPVPASARRRAAPTPA